MRGTAVAIPAARRCSERRALAVLFVRLNIVNDDESNVFEQKGFGRGRFYLM
jgi:hypothetical protein